jgi:hypothetical protein
MGELFGFIWCAIAGLFRSRVALQAEILVLRHQLNILRRRGRSHFFLGDGLPTPGSRLYRDQPPADMPEHFQASRLEFLNLTNVLIDDPHDFSMKKIAN